MNITMNNAAALCARVLMASIFIWSGYGTSSGLSELAKYLGSLGVPLPGLAADLVIVWELAGGLALILGLFTRASALSLGMFCVVAAFLVHFHPANMKDMIDFAKNMAMTGGFLFAALSGGGEWSLDEKLQLPWR